MARFEISYERGAYHVSIPNYDGGEVIDTATAGALASSLRELLPSFGWRNLSDDELHREAEEGNGFAPIILRARAALRAYDSQA